MYAGQSRGAMVAGGSVLFLAYHSWKREWLMFLIHGFIVGEPLDGVLLDAQRSCPVFYHVAQVAVFLQYVRGNAHVILDDIDTVVRCFCQIKLITEHNGIDNLSQVGEEFLRRIIFQVFARDTEIAVPFLLKAARC